MTPLAQALTTGQFGHAAQHVDAIRSALQRGLPEVAPAFYSHDGTCVLVGSGPSVSSFVEEIKAERAKGRPIVAIKGAHDFLIDNGITPDLFVSLEPRDRASRDVKHKNGDTVYLLASRCAPEMFEHLKDCKVMLWHSAGAEEEADALQECGVKMAVGGGSTSGLRAINLFYLQGFRNFVLYGFDSCLSSDGETKRVDGSKAGQTIPVICGGRRFVANYAMAAQADDFQRAVYGCLPDVHIEAKGDGLIAAIIEERKKLGKRT